jgi:dipeptidyl aminopeptidase/acylaminoacyl peptidase
MPELAPFGTWRSPITAEIVASARIRLGEPWVATDAVYWLEQRPTEGGRNVLARSDPYGEPVDVTPPGWNVRTRVHEYGGGSYSIHGATVFFSNFEDQRLYRQELAGEPVAITPTPSQPAALRYADGRVTPDGDTLFCIRERHDGREVVNEIVSLPADGSADPVVVASGADFFASPRTSPDGRRLAWLRWDHPRMPWDGTELWVAEVSDNARLEASRRVAGGPQESIIQPRWSPDGVLHVVSDRSGWWNLYRLDEPDAEPENVTPRDAEFGVPMWQLGYSTYDFLSDGTIACTYRAGGIHHLAILDPATRELLDLDVPYPCIPPYVRAGGTQVVFVGAGPTVSPQVVSLDLVTRSVDVLRVSELVDVDPQYLSVPEPIEFPTDGGKTAYAYFYAPTNRDFEAPQGERPPLIVHTHGGPTGEATPELDTSTQFFTSRGFAVVDVNYGGSTGYGREYRERLYGHWGVVDLRDTVNAARFLAERGDVDEDRLIITGGSAGGYTTICALAWTDVFAAGASYFGLADLEPFATSTHKFEIRYLDTLVGPWPEARELWRERSPIHAFDRISCPVIVFQGLEDEVVPPEQAELMVEALRAKGLPHAYLAFEGEQHGFRKAENIRRALEAEVSFYARVLGFELGDPVEPVEIANLG